MPRHIPLVLVASAVLLVPSAASAATTRYAAPGGLTTGTCTSTDSADPNGPCALPRAVQQAQNDDTVEVFEGTHDLGSSTVDTFGKTNLTIVGAPGQAVPVIVSTGLNAVVTARPTVTVRRLALVNNNPTGGIGVGALGGTLEQVSARATAIGCFLQSADSTLRDSVCWTTSNAAGAAGLVLERLSPGTVTMTLRNVTAIAPAAGTYGIRARAANTGTTVTVDGANVIARGGQFDVRADASSDTTLATVTLTHSNYATESEQVSGSGTSSVTNPGSGTNQTAAPIFANPAAGDFHQIAGSPTINAGTTDGLTGTADFEGETRPSGAAMDIGADEFVDSDSDGVADVADACPGEPGATANGCPEPPGPEPEPQAGDTSPPDTTITGGPSAKTKKKTATIAFSGSDARAVAGFQCRLDDGAFEACSSPKTYGGLKKGRHTVEVRAIDSAGNVDPTPASRGWKVKKKKKKS